MNTARSQLALFHFPFAVKESLYSFYIKYPYHLGIITKYLEIVGFDLPQHAKVGDTIIRINDLSVKEPH